MARFNIEIGAAGAPGFWFIGWDELNGRACEATDADRLGLPMTPIEAQRFADMAPGERRPMSTTQKCGAPAPLLYFRQY
jgi:hypothetical protein